MASKKEYESTLDEAADVIEYLLARLGLEDDYGPVYWYDSLGTLVPSSGFDLMQRDLKAVKMETRTKEARRRLKLEANDG